MIIVEIDGQTAKLIKGQWGGNETLAPTLEAIGEDFPFRGGGYFPDADYEEARFVMNEMIERNLAKVAKIISNSNVPLESENEDVLY
mgnify:CR=1 FL=1|jgi:hypothetical protein